jgi:5-methylcytosine-specific restriction endonuclease McrA
MKCDHVEPLSRSGSNDLTNLTTACKQCNLSKHNKTVEEWRAAQ